MQVLFTRWCLSPDGRVSVAVNPARVDIVEQYSPAFMHAATGECFPAASNIIMQGKQIYLVQGSVETVTEQLNGGNKQ